MRSDPTGPTVADGDTIRLRSGVYVRLIGIDTPEAGQCGYRAAKRKLDRWVGGSARLVNPAGVDDRDHYGRLIRYVHDSGRDTGLGLLRHGLAKARYDGRDGYDRHPRQATYRRADRNNPGVVRVSIVLTTFWIGSPPRRGASEPEESVGRHPQGTTPLGPGHYPASAHAEIRSSLARRRT